MFESCRAHFRAKAGRAAHGHDAFARMRPPRALGAKAGKARLRGDSEFRVLRDFRAHVPERDAWHGARDAADGLAVESQFVPRGGVASDVQDAEAAVDLASVVLPGNRFLTRITA